MRTGPRTVRSRVSASGADVVLVTVRELRLLLGLLLILFLTAETWRYVGQLPLVRLVLFVLVTVAAALLAAGLGMRRMLRGADARRAAIRVGVEVLAFGAVLFFVFAVVGVVSVDAGLAAEWSGVRDGVLWSFGVGSPPLVVTRPHLQVTAFLASVGSLAFALEVVADAGTRQTLVGDLIDPRKDGAGPTT